jgi:hypothetical protein
MSFEYTETFGALIRQFFRELFGSRYTQHLEEEILRLINDHDRTLHDRDVQLASQREEISRLNSKIATYDLTRAPRAARASSKFDFFSMPPTKSRWQVVQEQHDEQMRKELEEEGKAANAAKG